MSIDDTTLLLKRGAKHVRFYSPVVLRGTLWICTGITALAVKSLLEWKAAGHVDPIDLKIFWASVAAVAVDKWLTFMDTSVAQFRDDKKKRDATELLAKTQTAAEGHLR